jgi:hypothetical protein
MTVLSTSRIRPAPATESDSEVSPSAQRALRRRRRRQARMAHDRLNTAGRPVRSALIRVPFAVALIAVLGGGVGGVLYLNTKTDESGIRTVQAREESSQLRLEIEALGRSIAQLNATPRIAAEAKELGLVPAGDAAILVVGRDGQGRLIGTPGPAGQHPAGAAASGGGH